MNFKIQNKPAEDWNPILFELYVATNSKLLKSIIWFIERLITPKKHDYYFNADSYKEYVKMELEAWIQANETHLSDCITEPTEEDYEYADSMFNL